MYDHTIIKTALNTHHSGFNQEQNV
jgi:hypothetical protein